MSRSGFLLQALLLTALIAFTAGHSTAAQITFGSLDASLTAGSLAGTRFPVTYSYDASLISPSGDSYISLTSFDFRLLGTAFSRNDIFQGGQVVFHNGAVDNVTASFQVILPPNAPVENITFGFGGSGIIGYIDLAGKFGTGSFAFTPVAIPEPGTLLLAASAFGGLLLRSVYKKRRQVKPALRPAKRRI